LPVPPLMYLPTVWRLRREPYDVIHMHWVSRGIVGLLSGKPFSIQAHVSDLHQNIHTPGMFRLSRRVLQRTRVIFHVTPNLRSYIRRFTDKLYYLPNPIRVRAMTDAPRAPEQVRKVIIFMRLDPVKGVDRVFPATERLASEMEVTALRWGR
jgi:glycosyl transferase family 4